MIRKAGAFFALAFFILALSGCSMPQGWSIFHPSKEKEETATKEEEMIPSAEEPVSETEESESFAVIQSFAIPFFSDTAYAVVHDNVPFFTEEEKENYYTKTFGEMKEPGFIMQYSDLDDLGRCGSAVAVVSLDTLPEEDRGLIGNIRPSGWHTVKYQGIDGNYLYNRCHLIAYCLSGDNADKCNLITGTRYLNIVGMLPFEMQVLDHIVKNRDHVLYRATPVFTDQELVARGVLLEAWSMEDEGRSLSLCVFCYNVQPGIVIDYATGDSEQVEIIPMESFSES